VSGPRQCPTGCSSWPTSMFEQNNNFLQWAEEGA
jgi:hypothetical protein